MKRIRLSYRLKIVFLLIIPPLLLVSLSFHTIFQKIESQYVTLRKTQKDHFAELLKISVQQMFTENQILAQSIFLSYESGKGQLNASGLSLFTKNKHLIKFEIYDPKSENILFQIKKREFDSVSSPNQELKNDARNFSRFEHVNNFIFSVDEAPASVASPMRWKMYFESEKYFSPLLSRGSLSLWNKDQLLLKAGANSSHPSTASENKNLTKEPLADSDLSFTFLESQTSPGKFLTQEFIRTMIVLFVGFLIFILSFLPFVGNISYRMKELKKRVQRRMQIVTHKRTRKKIDELVYQKSQSIGLKNEWQMKTQTHEISYLAQTLEFDRGQFMMSFQRGSSVILGCFYGNFDAIETSAFHAASLVLFEQIKNQEQCLQEIFLSWGNGLSLIQSDDKEYSYSVFEFNTQSTEIKYFTKNNLFGLKISEDITGNECQIPDLGSEGSLQLEKSSSLVVYFGSKLNNFEQEFQNKSFFASSMAIRAEFCNCSLEFIKKSTKELMDNSLISTPTAIGCLLFKNLSKERMATLENESYEINYIYKETLF